MKIILLALILVIGSSCSTFTCDKHKHNGCGHKKQCFSKMDADNNGKVTQAEFMTQKKECFSKKDKNGDGFLTADEMSCMKHSCKMDSCKKKKCTKKTCKLK